MKKISLIQTFENIKLLADERRIQILSILMAKPATLSQLAKELGKSPAWVRHHTEKLLAEKLIEIDHISNTGKVTEKYYRAKSGAFLLQKLILPQSEKPVIIFSGSHDLALEQISPNLKKDITMLSMPVGSLDGLANLRQGLCQISGAHLLAENGEYNTPFVRHFFPDQQMDVITLAHRRQGLIVAPRNPLDIRIVTDLTRTGLRFINRNSGSGTRLWLDKEIKQLGILPEDITDYEHVVNTHTACAQAILNNQADVALGLQASAYQYGLGFIPLFDERYDLILPKKHEILLTPLLDYIQTAAFRKDLSALTGYTTTDSGEQITL